MSCGARYRRRALGTEVMIARAETEDVTDGKELGKTHAELETPERSELDL